jgi:diguanylate cyclase (GGDEF)-like protein
METLPAEHHVSGVYTKMLVEFLAETMPADRIHQLLKKAGESRSIDELGTASSWSSYHQFRRLLEERARLDSTTLYDQAGIMSRWLGTHEVSQTARTLESPGKILAISSEDNPLMPIRHCEKIEVAPNEWTMREWFADGYAPYPEFCDLAAVQYALIPTVFNLPLGEVTEEECQCRGDATCLFRLRWENRRDSSKADNYRVRSELLETRLAQIHEMIADLATNERYEDVLQGLVGSSLRAALTAGGAVLALEPRAGAPRKVYFEGLTESEADSIADDLLAGGAGSDNVFAVGVTSAQRHYGALAVDQGGGDFSSLSRTTLETYARLAATALDVADAMDDAHRQANTSQALLELAMSLTEIVSADEMAAKVARAVPDVIDCDRVAVLLYRIDQIGTHEDGFRLAGSFGYSDEAVTLLGSRSFDHLTANSAASRGIAQSTILQFGNAATVTAPITVARETIGFIAASVLNDPERLTVTPNLADRLKGLAAQASTAISNARLVDQIRFQALHDALTGLPNRALILDRTEQMLARARRSEIQVAALFIDLDGFKEVNDSLGHGVGDILLKAVTERLSLTMRESDSVGRLGGDEFVVLVDGATMDAGPELVAERLLEVLRTPFLLPELPGGPLTLTASIGIATGVRDSATELLRDADIALYEAKAAGKNGSYDASVGALTCP